LTDFRLPVDAVAIVDSALNQSPIDNPSILNHQSANLQSSIRQSAILNPPIANRQSPIVNS
jgi:hypothetical protein